MGSRSILTDSTVAYDTSNTSYFELEIPLIAHINELTFYHKYQTDSLLDGGYIEISYDSGANWKT